MGWALALAACAAPDPILAPAITQRPSPTAEVIAPTQAPTATPSPPPTASPPPITVPSRPIPAPSNGAPDPLSIPAMRAETYPGSAIVFDQTLTAGGNYDRFIVHYLSEGLKIYALLTIPTGAPPSTGWPVIVFNHGFIQPSDYQPTLRYEKYVDALASDGYIVFRPDYRGHGQSEGVATGGYSTPAYTIDVLNAVASIAYFDKADSHRIGMWGHSMGGQITLRAMVVSCCLIRAGVIWSGVVAPYDQIITRWEVTPTPPGAAQGPLDWRQRFVAAHGDAQANPGFWNDISPNSFLASISGPLEIQHAAGDSEVPVEMSRMLYSEMLQAGRTVYYFEYSGDDHNISHNYDLAMQRTLQFFDQYVKTP